MKRFVLKPYRTLFTTTALIENKNRRYYLILLVDTGSSFTIINPIIIEKLNIDTTTKKRKKIITASGYEFCDEVITENFYCFGKNVRNFSLLSHSVPFETYIDGILGMDFLTRFDFIFRMREGIIEYQDD